jgi:hypothetical protein
MMFIMRKTGDARIVLGGRRRNGTGKTPRGRGLENEIVNREDDKGDEGTAT